MNTIQTFASPRISTLPPSRPIGAAGYFYADSREAAQSDNQASTSDQAGSGSNGSNFDLGKILSIAAQAGATLAETISALKKKGQLPQNATVPIQYSPNYRPPYNPPANPKDKGSDIGWYIAGGVVLVGIIVTAIILIPKR